VIFLNHHILKRTFRKLKPHLGLNLLKLSIGVALLAVLLYSCRKERSFDELLAGKTWVLQSGRVYVEQLEAPFNKEYYDHFGSGQTRSNLQAFDSLSLRIDTLQQFVTTWRFNTEFNLNDFFYYPFETVNDRFVRVYGLENGSARVLEVLRISDEIMLVRTSRTYGNRAGKNIAWFSELLFTAGGISCTNCLPDIDYGYAYSGVVPPAASGSGTATYPLSGSIWLLEKYRQGLFEETLNDTLHFTGPITYRVNSELTERTYSLSGADGLGMRNFTLFECPSLPSGTPAWTSSVADFAIQSGAISNQEFSSYGNTASPITVWLERIN
jgi:hypothetical protein